MSTNGARMSVVVEVAFDQRAFRQPLRLFRSVRKAAYHQMGGDEQDAGNLSLAALVWRRCDVRVHPVRKARCGDLRLFIAEVKRFHMSVDRHPLVFSQGRYASLQPTEFAAPLWPFDIHS
jgi:hypothetical protein